MADYTLLQTTITFNLGEERYLDLLCREQAAQKTAREEYLAWYQKAGMVEAVLKDMLVFQQTLLEEQVLKPLFQDLAQAGIYDVGWKEYCAICGNYNEMTQERDRLQARYNEIEQARQAEVDYREQRKAGRTRWSGGGFGLGGAIKGAAQAAAMNAVSGLGHSAFNAVGNIGSAVVSGGAKAGLYRDAATQDTLMKALTRDIHHIFSLHIDFLNQQKGPWIIQSFSVNRSDALLENGKQLPYQRLELLRKAFQLCPWSPALLQYLFVEYPEDRVQTAALAKRFGVDLTPQMEQILAEEYGDEARRSEEAARQAKGKILALMRQFGMTESKTLDVLETDSLQRICRGYETADEAECNAMIQAVRKQDAQDRLKQPFLENLQKRLDAIWSAEDGAVFDQLYCRTDLLNPQSISRAAAEIRSKARTVSAQKYLDALQGCTAETIRKACLYRYSDRPKQYQMLLILSVVLIFVAAPVGIPAAIACFILGRQLKSAWALLTLGGTVIHPVLSPETMERLNRQKKSRR